MVYFYPSMNFIVMPAKSSDKEKSAKKATKKTAPKAAKTNTKTSATRKKSTATAKTKKETAAQKSTTRAVRKTSASTTRKASAKKSVATMESVSHENISVAAYYRWEQRGGTHGYDVNDWLDAEKEING